MGRPVDQEQQRRQHEHSGENTNCELRRNCDNERLNGVSKVTTSLGLDWEDSSGPAGARPSGARKTPQTGAAQEA